MKVDFVKRIGLFGLGVISCFSMQAQQKGTALEITLEKAIVTALNNNPLIKVAEQEIWKKKLAKQSIQSSFYPQIDAVGQYSRTIEGKTPVGKDNSWTGGFNLNLPIWLPSLQKNLSLSESDIESAIENARSSKIDMVNAICKAYYGILLAKDVLQVFQQSYENAVLSYNTIKDKCQQGLLSEFDLICADVNAKNIRPNIIQSQNAYRMACLSLKALMGVDMDMEISVGESLMDYEKELSAEISYPNLSMDTNSDLKQFDLRQEQLRRTLELYKAQYCPKISLTGNYMYISMSDDFRWRAYQWNPTSSIALNISIPVFDGLKKYNDIRQTKIGLEQMQWQREEVVRNLQLAVNNHLHTIKNYAEQAFSIKDVVLQAQKGYEIAQKLYDTGMGTLLDLNNAQLRLTQAGLAFIQSIYNFLVSKVDLDKVLGIETN